jgi:hypothetical protein
MTKHIPGAPVPPPLPHAQAHVGVEAVLPDGRKAIEVRASELRSIMRAIEVSVLDEAGYSEMVRITASTLPRFTTTPAAPL